MTEPTITLPQPQASSENYWRYVWRNVRRNRRGLAGLIVIAAMLAVWIFSPLLATNQPIVCKYNGRWYFPAVIEIFQLPMAPGPPHCDRETRPFNLPQFDAKKELDPRGLLRHLPLIPTTSTLARFPPASSPSTGSAPTNSVAISPHA